MVGLPMPGAPRSGKGLCRRGIYRGRRWVPMKKRRQRATGPTVTATGARPPASLDKRVGQSIATVMLCLPIGQGRCVLGLRGPQCVVVRQ